jgi:hypothetical protein
MAIINIAIPSGSPCPVSVNNVRFRQNLVMISVTPERGGASGEKPNRLKTKRSVPNIGHFDQNFGQNLKNLVTLSR